MKKNIKKITVAVVLILIILFIVGRLLGKNNNSNEETRPTVITENPSLQNIINTVDVIGTITPTSEVNVMPKISGDVLTVNFEIGQRVTEGDLLVSIDAKSTMDSLKIALDSAKISLDDANKALERTQALFATGAVSQSQLEQAQSSASGANLQYQSALNNYNTQSEYSNITAPISGIIESKNVEVHDTLSPGVVICSISGEGGLSVDFGVTEDAMTKLNTGDSISIDKSGHEYKASVTEVGTKIDSSGLFPVKAALASMSDALPSGTKVKLTVVSDKADSTLSIPMDAVNYSAGEAFVYVYNDGVAVKTDIEVGIYDEKYIQVLSGLDASSKVITSWSNELYDGAEVLLRDSTDSNQ